MSRINKFVLTVSLLIFIMISAVACGIYTQMVKERVYSLKQSVIDTAFAVANIAEYRRSVAIDLINTLNPTEEQLLVGLRTAYADSVSPSYLYDVGPYLISSDGNDSNLLIVFYVQIMPDDFVMQLHRF